jgi:hypothetical protein
LLRDADVLVEEGVLVAVDEALVFMTNDTEFPRATCARVFPRDRIAPAPEPSDRCR